MIDVQVNPNARICATLRDSPPPPRPSPPLASLRNRPKADGPAADGVAVQAGQDGHRSGWENQNPDQADQKGQHDVERRQWLHRPRLA